MKKKLLTILIIILLCLTGYSIFKYISNIKIFEPVTISVNGLDNNEFDYINVYGISPRNKILKLSRFNTLYEWSSYSKDNETNNFVWDSYYCYYKKIILCANDSIINKIKRIDIKIGKAKYTYDNKKFKQQWIKIKGQSRIPAYELPDNVRGNTGIISMLMSVFYLSGHIKTILILCLIIIPLLIIFYLIYIKDKSFFIRIYTKSELIFNRLLKKNSFKIIFILCLIIIYYIIFLQKVHFTDYADINGDALQYQSIGVNFAKGHGFQRQGKIEDVDVYKFDYYTDYTIFDKFINSKPSYDFYITPGYPLFLSIIYKIFGVEPIAVKNIQLLLLIIVAAFLPLIGLYFWKFSGFISGLIASPIFIAYNYKLSEGIQTEPLIVFFIFLIVLSYIYFNKKNNLLSSVILGVVFGLSLLIKGTLVFVPFLFFLYLLIRYYREKKKNILRNLLVILTVFILTIIPWSIYATKKAHSSNILFIQIREVLLDNKISKQHKTHILDSISPYHIKSFLLNDSIYIKDKADKLSSMIKNNKLIILSTNKDNILLDGNNEYATDGKWHAEWRKDIKNRNKYFYNNDNIGSSQSVKRVINFYKHHPKLIYKLPIAKITAAYTYFSSLCIIMILFIIESFGFLIYKYLKNKLYYISYLKIAIVFIALMLIIWALYKYEIYLFLNMNNHFLILILIFLLFLFLTKAKHTLFKIPSVFYIIFINLFFITIIFYAAKRHIKVMDFIFIIVSIQYLLKYVSCAIKNIIKYQELVKK